MAVILDVKEAKAADQIDNAGFEVQSATKNEDNVQNVQNIQKVSHKTDKKNEPLIQDKLENDQNEEPTENNNGGGARQNWRKLFAVRKFLSLAKYQSQAAPAQLLVANRYTVGKKIANGAFGQLRVGRDNETGHQVAIKLEAINARIPMLFLEHRFYKVRQHCSYSDISNNRTYRQQPSPLLHSIEI